MIPKERKANKELRSITIDLAILQAQFETKVIFFLRLFRHCGGKRQIFIYIEVHMVHLALKVIVFGTVVGSHLH